MDFLTQVAKLTREHQLHLRVHILHAVLDDKLALLARAVDVFQFCEQFRQLVFLQQSDALEHGDMCHRAEHVILGKVHIHLAVASHCEPLYFFIDFKSFLPQFIGHNTNVEY